MDSLKLCVAPLVDARVTSVAGPPSLSDTCVQRVLLVTARRMAASIALAGALIPGLVLGQNDSVKAGGHIRFRAPGIVQGRQKGILLSRTSDSIVVAIDPTTELRVAMASISELEINKGKSAALGAKTGALWGAGIGLAAPYLLCDGAACRFSPLQRFGYALYSAALNGGLGAFIGWRIGRDEWVSYEGPSAVRVSLQVGVTSRSTRAGMRLRF